MLWTKKKDKRQIDGKIERKTEEALLFTQLSGERSHGSGGVNSLDGCGSQRIETTTKKKERGKERGRESQQMVDLARPGPRRCCRSPSGMSADPRSISHT